jgi:hypothetical protein
LLAHTTVYKPINKQYQNTFEWEGANVNEKPYRLKLNGNCRVFNGTNGVLTDGDGEVIACFLAKENPHSVHDFPTHLFVPAPTDSDDDDDDEDHGGEDHDDTAGKAVVVAKQQQSQAKRSLQQSDKSHENAADAATNIIVVVAEPPQAKRPRRQQDEDDDDYDDDYEDDDDDDDGAVFVGVEEPHPSIQREPPQDPPGLYVAYF